MHQQSKPKTQKSRLSLMLVPVALALSACGGGDESSIISTPSPHQATASTQTANAQATSSQTSNALQSQLDTLNAKLQEAYAKLQEGEQRLNAITQPAQDLPSTNSQSQPTDNTNPKTDKPDSNRFAELDKAIAATSGRGNQSNDNQNTANQDAKWQAQIKKLEAQIDDLQKQKQALDEKLTNASADEALKKAYQEAQAELLKIKAELKKRTDKEQEEAQAIDDEKARQEAIKKKLQQEKEQNEQKRLEAEQARTKTQLHRGADATLKALNDLKVKYEPGRDHFGGAILSINKDGSAKATILPETDYSLTGGINEAFEKFKIGNTTINLLEQGSKFHLRELTAKDFPEGGFGTGFIGSKDSDWRFGAFGEMRYGVYNDPQGTSHLFVYGNPSSATKHGSPNYDIIYRGSAIIGKDGNYRPLPKAVTAVLDKNKTDLKIAIKTDKNALLEVPTTLNAQFKEYPIAGGEGKYLGQKFAGENELMTTNGALFGTAELGGFFAVKQGVHAGENGVFGASFDSDYLKSDEDFKEALANNER